MEVALVEAAAAMAAAVQVEAPVAAAREKAVDPAGSEVAVGAAQVA